MTGGPLVGCSVVVTRERPGELGRLLAVAGASVVHVPLIEIVDPHNGGVELDAALDALDGFDWVIVTSPIGAERVGPSVRSGNARLASVGTATARRFAELAERRVDLVPQHQLADSLAAEFIALVDGAQSVLIAQAGRAAPTLVDALRSAGHDVTAVTAYDTALRRPTPLELEKISTADALLFASGSAVQSFVEAIGPDVPPPSTLVVAIGPTTAAVASELGLKVSSVAADHSLAGLVNELATQWARRLGG